MNKNKHIYYMTVEDVQNVAEQIMERFLTDKEIKLIENDIAEYVNWFDAIEAAINKHFKE